MGSIIIMNIIIMIIIMIVLKCLLLVRHNKFAPSLFYLDFYIQFFGDHKTHDVVLHPNRQFLEIQQ